MILVDINFIDEGGLVRTGERFSVEVIASYERP